MPALVAQAAGDSLLYHPPCGNKIAFVLYYYLKFILRNSLFPWGGGWSSSWLKFFSIPFLKTVLAILSLQLIKINEKKKKKEKEKKNKLIAFARKKKKKGRFSDMSNVG